MININDLDFISFVRKNFDQPDGQIILHDPCFIGNERKYLMDAKDSDFHVECGEYVGKFEKSNAEKEFDRDKLIDSFASF